MKKQVGLFLLGILAGVFMYSVFSFNGVEDKSSAILKVLKSNCKCDQINQFLYAKGLEISDKGSSTETAEYELKNCDYKDLRKEANRINQILLNEVDGYEDIDRFTMEFVDKNSIKFITISNGIVNN